MTAVTDSAAAGAPGRSRRPAVPSPRSAADSEPSLAARVEALDGSERIILLGHLARAYPDVVEAGFELVAQWRADNAERRRVAARRKDHDRRRRRAAEPGGG